MMKLVVTFLMAAALAACGGKSSPSTTPQNQGTTDTQGTGGTEYGGAQGEGGGADNPEDPCAGM
jgi:hypothetical protein